MHQTYIALAERAIYKQFLHEKGRKTMNMIQKLKKSKKGFTLVELLVVLVILAILAAAIIPSMMGFIDKAKEESAAAECRNVILAADIVMNELYGQGKLTATTKLSSTDIEDIGGLKAGSITTDSVTVAEDTNRAGRYFVNAAIYTASNGNTYTYKATTSSDGVWTGAGIPAPTATPGA